MSLITECNQPGCWKKAWRVVNQTPLCKKHADMADQLVNTNK